MPITHDRLAPYGPPQTVIELIEAFRDRGLTTPFTADVLLRSGVSEGLVNRTLSTLRLLDLTDKEGNPTQQFEALRLARGQEEYQAALQDWLRGVYADILKFCDPAVDDADRVGEAFRGFLPPGQRGRMVTLMLGLFRYAGIAPANAARERRPERKTRTVRATAAGKGVGVGSANATRVRASQQPMGPSATAWNGESLPPALTGLIQQIPFDIGWDATQRKDFLKAFEAVLDFSVTVRDKPQVIGPAYDDDAEDDP
jgi:hypothetical protein